MNSINTNMSALSAQRNMTEQAKLLNEAAQRLSSGKELTQLNDLLVQLASKMESQIGV